MYIFKGPGEEILPKIADFGFSLVPDQDNNEVLFKPAKSWPWYAPEYHHRGFSITGGRKQDAYSFGMLCFWVVFHTELSAAARTSSNNEFIANDSAQPSEEIYALLEQWKLTGSLQDMALDMVATKCYDIHQDILTKIFRTTLAFDPNQREGDFDQISALLNLCPPRR